MTPDRRPVDDLAPSLQGRRAADERRIGRLLIAVTYVAVAVLLAGVGLMLLAGVSPLEDPPAIEFDGVVQALSTLEPTAVLLVGIALVIATPLLRVAAAGVSYARSGERGMVVVSVAILVVIAIGIATAMVLPEA